MKKEAPSRRRAGLLALALLVSLPFVAPAALAAAGPGQVDHAELAVSFRNQGLGGPVVVTATLFIGSDPHRLLYVEGLTLNLTVPTGLGVVEGENPRVFPAFPVPASAAFYAPTFSWTLNSTQVGNFELLLQVSSAAAGSAFASANVSIREGPVLGKVTLQPGSPTTTSTLDFAVPARTGFDDPDVLLNVTLYVYQTTSSIKPASATNNTLRLANADRSWSFVVGTPLRMEAAGGEVYAYSAPPLARGALVYWVYAEARLANGTVLGTSTTAPVKVFIEDPSVTAGVYWGALISITVIFAASLYVMMYDPWARRPAEGTLHNSPDRIRVSLALLAIGAVFLALAFLTGAAVGLWRWFGYL